MIGHSFPLTYIKKERGCLTSARLNFEVYHNLIQKYGTECIHVWSGIIKHNRIVCIRAQHALCTQRNVSKRHSRGIPLLLFLSVYSICGSFETPKTKR